MKTFLLGAASLAVANASTLQDLMAKAPAGTTECSHTSCHVQDGHTIVYDWHAKEAQGDHHHCLSDTASQTCVCMCGDDNHLPLGSKLSAEALTDNPKHFIIREALNHNPNDNTPTYTFEGECTNGELIEFALRTQDNHCGQCNNGYTLYNKSCVKDCVVGTWDTWSVCTKTCGDGSQSRSRTLTQPAIGGAACPNSAETQQCNNGPCPIDGGWSDWGAWGTCTKTCGTGTKTRSRTCNNPIPQHNGSHCSGSASESENCNTSACPIPTSLATPAGFTCTARKNVCYKAMGSANHHHAIDQCKQLGARVCEHNDMFELCGDDINPYSASSNGWYGDHGTASGGNWDDEYGTWNSNQCGDDNDGAAYHASDSKHYNCCKMGDLSGSDTSNHCPSGLNTMSTPNGEICAGGLEGKDTMHNAIGVCRGKQAHVCTHNDMMQLAAYDNPWSGSTNGWYGDHGKAPDGNWDDEFGTWNRNQYDSNNDGPAYHATAQSFHYRCCGTSTKNDVCPSGFDLHSGVCYEKGGSAKMHSAIGDCRGKKSHVCEHNEFQQMCYNFNPYDSVNAGWYGDHGTASGGNWDNEYGAWNNGSCNNNNDGAAYHQGDHDWTYRCCTAPTTNAALVWSAAPTDRDTFNTKFVANGGLVERTCPGCGSDHQTIVYKRISAMPAGKDWYQLFMQDWFSTDNNLNTDFKLYSSVSDAETDTNAWTSCNYDDPGVGFPRDCGKNGLVGGQWNSLTRGGQSATWEMPQ